MYRFRAAFTLVELSIVLVILGLLVGGVLTGQSLIHAAELRALTNQYQRYTTAVMTFKDKYFAIPGDMTNAQSYWGVAAAGNGCYTTASTTAVTCNGDGDGQIAPSAVGTAQSNDEFFRFWQHLANAGLIEGSYNGYGGANGYTAIAANSPAIRGYTNGLWSAIYEGAITGNPGGFNGNYGNVFGTGGIVANNTAGAGFMKPEDMYNIDTKLDDGLPATGKVNVGAPGGLNTCTTTASSTNYSATYLLTSSAAVCEIVFSNQF